MNYDPDVRQAEPGEDDFSVCKIEMDFAIPVWLTREQERDLHRIIGAIVDRPCNKPAGGVHWPSGYGSKPQWSREDARFLGVRTDDDAPESGEPTFDSEVLYFETTAREK